MKSSVSFPRWLKDRSFAFLAWLSAAVALFFLGAIAFKLVESGIGGLFKASTYTESTPAPMSSGGLLNAIVGSLIMTSISLVIATPIGILIATFLTEFKEHHRIGNVVRFLNDILLSAPSIIVGLFVYALLVVPMGGFSGIAGAIALAVIAIPMIARTTEDVLNVVPNQLREAAIALGLPRWRVTFAIIYRSATAGMITAVLLALGRVAGETAPLLFTALNDSYFSTDLGEPMPNLPVVIFQFAMSPYENWKDLAWTASLLITLIILTLNISSRVLFRRKTGS